jgi:hypothetical protein
MVRLSHSTSFPIPRWVFASPPSSAGFGMFGLWASVILRLGPHQRGLSHLCTSGRSPVRWIFSPTGWMPCRALSRIAVMAGAGGRLRPGAGCRNAASRPEPQ